MNVLDSYTAFVALVTFFSGMYVVSMIIDLYVTVRNWRRARAARAGEVRS